MPPTKKTKAEQYAEIPIEEIIRMTTSAKDLRELRRMVNVLRQGFKRREAQFKRRGMYSYAADKYGGDTPTVSSIVKNKTAAQQRNALLHEFAKYQAFFESKSSTIEGISEINRKQDINIFGADEEGNPLGTLDEAARKTYWSLYREFLNSNEADVRRLGSDRVQQVIADFTESTYMSVKNPQHVLITEILNRAAPVLAMLGENERPPKALVQEILHALEMEGFFDQ